MGEFDHHTNACKNEAKCVNCHKNHQSKSNQCEIWKKEKEIMKIKVTQQITYLEAKKIQENQPEITFAKVVQSLNTKPETKETSTQFNEKDSVIKANSKVITPTLNLNLNPHLLISLDHQQNLKTVHKHSRLKQVDHNRDPGPGQLTRKEKMEKKKIKIKNQIHIVKGRRPIRSSWSIGFLENMELEIDSSMFSQSQRKQKD